jgi:hypothetical protein
VIGAPYSVSYGYDVIDAGQPDQVGEPRINQGEAATHRWA